MNSQRPVLQRSANNQRLQYPIYGQFGFEEPVGRKKYSAKQSAIHKIIFNHDIDTTLNRRLREHNRLIHQQSMNIDYQTEKIQFDQSEGNSSRKMSNPHHYSLSQKSGRYSPTSQWNEQYNVHNPFTKQYSQRQNEVSSPSPERASYGQKEKSSIGLESSELFEQRAFPIKRDSLDLLMNPFKAYDERRGRNKQKALDGIIRGRSRNPTFLNSQI